MVREASQCGRHQGTHPDRSAPEERGLPSPAPERLRGQCRGGVERGDNVRGGPDVREQQLESEQ